MIFNKLIELLSNHNVVINKDQVFYGDIRLKRRVNVVNLKSRSVVGDLLERHVILIKVSKSGYVKLSDIPNDKTYNQIMEDIYCNNEKNGKYANLVMTSESEYCPINDKYVNKLTPLFGENGSYGIIELKKIRKIKM